MPRFCAQTVRISPAQLLKKKLRQSDTSSLSYGRESVFRRFALFGRPRGAQIETVSSASTGRPSGRPCPLADRYIKALLAL